VDDRLIRRHADLGNSGCFGSCFERSAERESGIAFGHAHYKQKRRAAVTCLNVKNCGKLKIQKQSQILVAKRRHLINTNPMKISLKKLLHPL